MPADIAAACREAGDHAAEARRHHRVVHDSDGCADPVAELGRPAQLVTRAVERRRRHGAGLGQGDPATVPAAGEHRRRPGSVGARHGCPRRRRRPLRRPHRRRPGGADHLVKLAAPGADHACDPGGQHRREPRLVLRPLLEVASQLGLNRPGFLLVIKALRDDVVPDARQVRQVGRGGQRIPVAAVGGVTGRGEQQRPAESEDVRGLVGVLQPAALLRRRVRGTAHGEARCGLVPGLRQVRQAEVDDPRTLRYQQHVSWFEIAVHQPGVVNIAKRPGDANRQAPDRPLGQRPGALHHLLQRRPWHQLGGQPQRLFISAVTLQAWHVFAGDSLDRPDFLAEAGPESSIPGQLGLHDLNGDKLAAAAGDVDMPEPARAQAPDDLEWPELAGIIRAPERDHRHLCHRASSDFPRPKRSAASGRAMPAERTAPRTSRWRPRQLPSRASRTGVVELVDRRPHVGPARLPPLDRDPPSTYILQVIGSGLSASRA